MCVCTCAPGSRGPRKFRPICAARPRGGDATRATTVFPAAALVKVSDYRKNVCTISCSLPPRPFLVPVSRGRGTNGLIDFY